MSIGGTRGDLDLHLDGDPAEALFDWTEERGALRGVSGALTTSRATAEAAAVVKPAGSKSPASMEPARAAKAILAAGRFGLHEPDIWHHTKSLEPLAEPYRLRLGLDDRLIVHWQPGKVLRIVNGIPRQDLESWIRRQG